MVKSLTELSQILVAIGISILASQEEQILTVIKNLNVALHPKEDIEVSFDSPFQSIEETKK
jgi:hypothetical protein